MPFYPDPKDNGEGLPFIIDLYWEHLCAEYIGASVPEILELDIVDFLALRRDAFIAELSKSEDGREYLKNARMFNQTEPDRKRLREVFGKGGED